jgi:hypothetical protein
MVISVADARARNLSCSGVLFYAFDASYPDGSCAEGYLHDDDAVDDDGCYTDEGAIPCPLCNAAEYDEYVIEGQPVAAVDDLVQVPKPASRLIPRF